MESMDLNDFFNAIKKNILLITALTLIASASAWAVSQFIMERIYKSTATIIMSGTSTLEYGEKTCEYSILLDKNLIKVFNNIAESDTVAENVIKSLELNYTVKELRKIINIDVEEETGIIKISAITNDPERSRDIICEFIESLKTESQIFVVKLYIHIIDAPKLPTKPVSPNIPLNILLSAAGGILTGILLSILLHNKSNYKTNIGALSKVPWLFVIGYLPRLKSTHSNSGQPVYSGNKKNTEFLKAIRTNMMYLSNRESIRKIVITSPGSSEGKTTVAINMAASLSQLKKKILLVDCNIQKPILYKLFMNGKQDATYHKVDGYIVMTILKFGFDIVTDVMAPRIQCDINFQSLKTMLEALEPHYDLIILDCPSVLSSADTLSLAEITKNVVLVSDYRSLAHQQIEKCSSILAKAEARILGIIVNRVPARKCNLIF